MSDFYGTIDDADAYHAARGNTAWAQAASSPDEAREGALLRASVWIDGRFRSRFPGKKTGGRSQIREWPRTDAEDAECNDIPDDEVPREVLDATFEAALRELTTPGYLAPDFVASQHVVSERVGQLATTYSDKSFTADDMRPVLTAIDDILAPLLGNVTEVSIYGTSARA